MAFAVCAMYLIPVNMVYGIFKYGIITVLSKTNTGLTWERFEMLKLTNVFAD